MCCTTSPSEASVIPGRLRSCGGSPGCSARMISRICHARMAGRVRRGRLKLLAGLDDHHRLTRPDPNPLGTVTRAGRCHGAPAGSRWRCWATRRRSGGCCWCGSTRPSIRRAASGRAAARSPRAAGCGQHIGKDGAMTGKTEREIMAEAEEEFERRAAADNPAEFIPHGQPPRGRAQVYSVRIPADALAALRRLAEARGQLPSVLIRGWVLELLLARAFGASNTLCSRTSGQPSGQPSHTGLRALVGTPLHDKPRLEPSRPRPGSRWRCMACKRSGVRIPIAPPRGLHVSSGTIFTFGSDSLRAWCCWP